MLDETRGMADVGSLGDDVVEAPFVEKIKKRVIDDIKAGKDFMRDYHSWCVTQYSNYHNSASYSAIRKKKRVPVPFYQQQIDVFSSFMADKLFYKDRPCTIVPADGGDKAVDDNKGDADVKQKLFDWQDYKDGLKTKFQKFLRDVAMYRVAVAQVDYKDDVRKQLVGYDEPIEAPDGLGGSIPLQDGQGAPITISRVRVEEVVRYRGPVVKRIDPIDFFVTSNKREMCDDEPVMIRSRHPLSYFKSEPYFLQSGYDELSSRRNNDGRGGGSDDDQHLEAKRLVRGLSTSSECKRDDVEYFEWQGRIDKRDLYEYLGKPTEIDQNGVMVPLVSEGEKVIAIVGIADGQVLMRLDETWLECDRPNVIVGVIQPDENEVLGVSIADKISAIHEAKQELRGIQLENFVQSVDAGHIINRAMVVDPEYVVNKPGFVIEVNGNVNEAHKRVEQGHVAPDIYAFDQQLTQDGQNASGIQDIIGGQGEMGVETLGESEMVASQASQRLIASLKAFEETFVEPLYDLRNQINMQFIDIPYLYGVVGEGAIEWGTIEPGQVRANVNFLCESSARETNKMVISQQIIQVVQLAPSLIQFGFPVRLDKLTAQLCEQGFSWTTEQTKKFFPSLNLPDEVIDEMLIQNMMTQMAMQRVAAMMGMAQQGAQSQQSPEPRNNEEATASAAGKNRTQIGRE